MLTQFKIKHVPKNKKVGDGRGLYFLKVGPVEVGGHTAI